MSEPLSNYLAMEAGEYLAELQSLLAGSDEPDADKAVRLARAIRGSARMADATAIAAVAEKLEDAADSVLSGDLAWSDDLRRLSLRTIEDLKILVNATGTWGLAEEQRAREALERWNPLASNSTDAPIPITRLFFDYPGISPDDSVVPVETLTIDASKALEESLRLKAPIEQQLASSGSSDSELRELLDELFSLIDIAAAATRA
ncbi:MAG TPA: Hpt domain-containing protein [Longimicrobiaceae bacterium]|nr:Hpt domain-containing protein [Longimicrobiaceae bacterium]